MATSNKFNKDPDATLDYGVNWSAWLGQDVITASTWIVPDGLTMASNSHDPVKTTVWLSGGTDGQKYEVTNRITTAGGRVDDRTIELTLKNK